MERTLTEMIYNSYMPLNEEQRDCIKQVFKEWLKTVGLTNYYALNRDGIEFNATESIRRLLIALVDEPSYTTDC